VQDSALAVAAMHDLVRASARGHRDRDEAYAWSTLIGVIGYDLSRPDEAMAMSSAASAAVLRAGDPVDLRASLLLSEAEVIDIGPRAAEGMARLSEARRLLIAAGAEQSGSPLAEVLADVLLETGVAMAQGSDVDGAVVMLRNAIERYRSIFGIDSTSEAIARHNLGETLRFAGQPDPALEEFRAAARINELHSGTSPRRSR
jgi:tetratricopeptide (TPR) repeat protein